MKIFAALLFVLLVACASHNCRREPPIASEHIRSALQLPANASLNADAIDGHDARFSKPQVFHNIPDGCYWRVTFRARISPSQERMGTALFRANDGSLVAESATIAKYY